MAERKEKIKPKVVVAYPSGKPDSIVVTIPKKMREQLGIEEGQHMVVRLEGKRIVYEPLDVK